MPMMGARTPLVFSHGKQVTFAEPNNGWSRQTSGELSQAHVRLSGAEATKN